MSDDPELPSLTRRTLFKVSLPVIAAAGLGVTGCGGAAIPTSAVVAGRVDRFGPGAPQRLEGYDVFILRDERGIAAVSGRCPHVGCGVRPADDGGFLCGCHGSTFAADGTVTQGPAASDLSWYAVRVENGEVVVDPTREVAKGTFTAL